MGLAKHYYTDGGLSAVRSVREKVFFGLEPKKVSKPKQLTEKQKIKSIMRKLGL